MTTPKCTTRPIRKRTHEARNGLQGFQSILAPERFTTSAHFAESLRITSANSSGVPPAGSSPISPNRALNMGETIALLIEEFSLSTTGLAIPAGPITPLQVLAS